MEGVFYRPAEDSIIEGMWYGWGLEKAG